MTGLANVLALRDTNILDVPASLRALADNIERGEYADAHNCAWVVDCGNGRVEVGLLGPSASSGAEAYLLLGKGMRRLEGFTSPSR